MNLCFSRWVAVALGLLMLAVLSPIDAEAVDQELAWYGKAKGQPPQSRARIWLMERDGSQMLWVYETCGRSTPDWSPDGRSLAILQQGFRDVPGFQGVLRLDLADPPTEPTTACPDDLLPRIADGSGTLAAAEGRFAYLDGLPYDGVWAAKWSPLGDEVAVLVAGAALDTDLDGHGISALTVADPDVLCEPIQGVGTCQSVVPIYHRNNADIWDFDWSPDGSEIMVAYDVVDASQQTAELAIIDRSSGIATETWSVSDVVPSEVEATNDIAWAATFPEVYSGPVIAFHEYVPAGRNKLEPRVYLLDLGDPAPMAEPVGAGFSATWSHDGRYLAVSSPDEDPQSIDLSTGAVTDLAEFWFAWRPDWSPAAGSPGCLEDNDCVDGNPCTDDLCSGGECSNPANWSDCDDMNPCTFNDVCTESRCIGETIVDGASTDCAGWCCDGQCLPGATECPACLPRGGECYFDSECCSGQCHAIKFTCK